MHRRRLPQSDERGSVPHVLLAGRPGLLIDALRLALTAEKMEVSVAPITSDASFADVMTSRSPDVVVIPDGDPDVTVDLVRSVVEIGGSAVTITRDPDAIDSARFVDAGASFVVGFDTSYTALARTIEKLSAGELELPLGQRYQLEEKLRAHRKVEARRLLIFEELSPRERAVFALIYEGLAADQIADEQCVSVSTVRTHIRNILNKLNVHSQLAAVALARSHHWFTPELLDESG